MKPARSGPLTAERRPTDEAAPASIALADDAPILPPGQDTGALVPVGIRFNLAPDSPGDLTEEIERGAAGALLIAGDTYRDDILARVGWPDFLDMRCRFAVHTVECMVAAGDPVSPESVAAYADRHALLPSRPQRAAFRLWIHDLAAYAPPPANGAWFAEVVAELAARRRLADLGRRLADTAADGPLDELCALLASSIVQWQDTLSRLRAAADE